MCTLQQGRELRKKRKIWIPHGRIGWNKFTRPMVHNCDELLILRNKYQNMEREYSGIYRLQKNFYGMNPNKIAKYTSIIDTVYGVNPIYDNENEIIYFIAQHLHSKTDHLYQFNIATKTFENIYSFSDNSKIISISLINNNIHYFYECEIGINYAIISRENKNLNDIKLSTKCPCIKSLQNIFYLQKSQSIVIICNNSMIYRKKLNQNDETNWQLIKQFEDRTNFGSTCIDNIVLLFGGLRNQVSIDEILWINLDKKNLKTLYFKCPIVGSFYAISNKPFIDEIGLKKLTFGFIRQNTKQNISIPYYLCELTNKYGSLDSLTYLILKNQCKFRTGAPNVWSVQFTLRALTH